MLTLYHAPQSRAFSTLWLIEELGVPYAIETVDIRAEGGAPESYRAIQPHRKVPAIVHEGIAVTERAAIAIHLADAFPEAGLAPPVGDPRRGPYLSWLVYADSVMDPVLAARLLGWHYDPRGLSFGSYDDMAAGWNAAWPDAGIWSATPVLPPTSSWPPRSTGRSRSSGSCPQPRRCRPICSG